MSEEGMITNVSYPASAKKGSEIEVVTTVKNTGTETAEFRVYLKDPAGKVIDKEPDTYRSVKSGGSTIIKTSTHWDPLWAMPGCDWNLSVELWELDWGIPKDRLDTRTFTIKLDIARAENGRIVNVSYPASAYKGAEITVDTRVMNTGTETAEFRVYLKDPAGRVIDKEPDTYRSLKPGYASTIRTSTHWDPIWAMPGYDWNLSVELWEIDVVGKDLLQAHAFTVKHKATPGEVPEIPPEEEPYIPPPPEEEPYIPPPPEEEPYIPPPPEEEPYIPPPTEEEAAAAIAEAEAAVAAARTEEERITALVELAAAIAAAEAAKRLTYEEAMERINAGLPVYIKFDIPVLDQIPGILWAVWMPVLPGFVLKTEP